MPVTKNFNAGKVI